MPQKNRLDSKKVTEKNMHTETKSKQLMPLWEQFLMYTGIFIGVYFSSWIREEQNITTLIAASITALIIMPQVFEKLNVNPGSPLLVRFGLFVQNGVFGDVLLEALGGKLSS